MATLDQPRFERVEQISSPGQFMFATDLVERFPQSIGNLGSETDVIFGQRPDWEFDLINLLRREFPYARCLTSSTKLWTDWYGQDGRIQIGRKGREYYHLFRTIEDRHHMTFLLQAVNEDGQVMHEGPPNFDPQGGLIELELFNSQPFDDARHPFWRGAVRLGGQKPEDMIKFVTAGINQDIERLAIPTWQDLKYEAPLSQVGHHFVRPSVT